MSRIIPRMCQPGYVLYEMYAIPFGARRFAHTSKTASCTAGGTHENTPWQRM